MIDDRTALEACTPWGGENDTRPALEGFGMAENDSAIQRLQHAGYPFKVVVRKLEQLDRRGWIEYGVSLNYPWRTPEGEAELRNLQARADV